MDITSTLIILVLLVIFLISAYAIIAQILDLRSGKMKKVADLMGLTFTPIIMGKKQNNYMAGTYKGKQIIIFDYYKIRSMTGYKIIIDKQMRFSRTILSIDGITTQFQELIPPKKLLVLLINILGKERIIASNPMSIK